MRTDQTGNLLYGCEDLSCTSIVNDRSARGETHFQRLAAFRWYEQRAAMVRLRPVRYRRANSKASSKQIFEVIQMQGIGPVGKRMVRVGVHFEEERIAAGCHGGLGQGWNHLALASRGRAAGTGTRQLNRVRRIEDDRCAR
jgi:hypothetical protein